MTQFILTKESPEIIRFFRNISTLSKMLDDQEKPSSGPERRALHYRQRVGGEIEADTKDAG